MYLLTCKLNSTSANYKVSTRIQIQHKTVQTHKNETLNKTKTILQQQEKKSNINEVTGQNPEP
jgi:hypothetical protein